MAASQYLPLLILMVAVTMLELAPVQIMAKPEKVHCNRKSCKTLTCPTSCPRRLTEDGTSHKACFADCNACQATCRHRIPYCYDYGAVCYDPRFIGGDGVMFYFHGKKDQDFCLVSDKNLHINAHFIGKRPEGRLRDYTWVQALGFVFDSHSLTVAVKKVATWDDKIDQLWFSYDGMPLEIAEGDSSLWASREGEVTVQRTTETNSVHITIKGKMSVSLVAVPITAEDSKVHNYQITEEDCFAHLDMQFNFDSLTPTVDGVLGQTYQPGFKSPVKRGVPMPIMGGDDKFSSSSLLSTDCKMSQFSATADEPNVQLAMQASMSIKCSASGLTKTGGIVCRR